EFEYDLTGEYNDSCTIEEEEETTPPIVKLAIAFKKWVESIKDYNDEESDTENEEENRDELAQIAMMMV
ncbi:MAG: hypothetical protein LCH62_21575, partial [Proteobacteria bacterium]|nr:hypothetical protein [Pseudomonadota bacterium]